MSATTAIIILGEGRKTTRPNLGHYGVTALIGEGGMGQVYQATDTRLDRTVAIKVLPEHVAADRELEERPRKISGRAGGIAV